MDELIETLQNISFSHITSELMFVLENLHFIRADWFYAFIPLILYLIFTSKKTLSARNWSATIDQQLLPYVLTSSANKPHRYPLLLIFIAVSLCITALAGPVYKKLPQPVYREQSSLVILLDLSQSMNATDVKPSRLSRAKLELLDILKTRKTGQTALIVYAADAFVVTPLTDDNATIANLAPSLETSMMPAQGSNLSIALAKTFSLFTQAGIIKGDILVITDDIHQRDEDAIKKVTSQGHRLSIFGTGTAQGGPIPLDESQGGGFLQDSKGAIVIPKLHTEKLQRYALSGSGLYMSLRADDSDIEKLTDLLQSKEVSRNTRGQNANADTWQEEGHWLLLPLLFFAALWTRKGWLAAALPFAIIFIMATPKPVHAEYIDSKNLWSSQDQKAMKAFNAGDNETAARQFTLPEWKASAYYRDGDFESAAKALEGTSHSDGYYNKANALAKLGKYKEAIEAYDRALELNTTSEDVIYNREQVKLALEQQKKEESQQDDADKNDEQEKSDQESDDSENSESEDSSSDDSESQDKKKESEKNGGKEDPDKKEKNSEQASEKNNESEQEKQDASKQDQEKDKEQQQNEEQQLEQRDAEAEKKQQEKENQQYEQDQKDSVENKDSDEKPQEVEVNPVEASITEEEKADEQWLKRIPDDPGGLLRRKFLYQYKKIPNQKDDNEPW